MKKSISIIAGCLMVATSLFACARGPVRTYPTATPAGNTPRTTVTHAPYHAAPRATAAPRTTTIPRNLVPNVNTMPGRMTTPNIDTHGRANPSMPRSGMTTDSHTGTPHTGYGTDLAPRTGGTEIAPHNADRGRVAPRNHTTHRGGTTARRHGTHSRTRAAARRTAPQTRTVAPARGVAPIAPRTPR